MNGAPAYSVIPIRRHPLIFSLSLPTTMLEIPAEGLDPTSASCSGAFGSNLDVTVHVDVSYRRRSYLCLRCLLPRDKQDSRCDILISFGRTDELDELVALLIINYHIALQFTQGQEDKHPQTIPMSFSCKQSGFITNPTAARKQNSNRPSNDGGFSG